MGGMVVGGVVLGVEWLQVYDSCRFEVVVSIHS